MSFSQNIAIVLNKRRYKAILGMCTLWDKDLGKVNYITPYKSFSVFSLIKYQKDKGRIVEIEEQRYLPQSTACSVYKELLYMNFLLYRFIDEGKREGFFSFYTEAVQRITEENKRDMLLLFQIFLLRDIGYMFPYRYDATGEKLKEEIRYSGTPVTGLYPCTSGVIQGAALLKVYRWSSLTDTEKEELAIVASESMEILLLGEIS